MNEAELPIENQTKKLGLLQDRNQGSIQTKFEMGEGHKVGKMNTQFQTENLNLNHGREIHMKNRKISSILTRLYCLYLWNPFWLLLSPSLAHPCEKISVRVKGPGSSRIHAL